MLVKYLMENFKSYLLLEGRIENAKKLAPTFVAYGFFDKVVDIDPTPQKKYLEWIAKHIEEVFKFKIPRLNDPTEKESAAFMLCTNWKRMIKRFNDLVELKYITGKQSDINSYYDANELYAAIDVGTKKKEEKEALKQAKKDKIVIYEKKGDPWYVIQPTSHNASRVYGLQTKWCISEWDNSEHWDDYYTSRRIKFVFIIDKRTNGKWCVVYGGDLGNNVECYDQEDNDVSLFDIKKVVPPDIFNVVLDYIGIPNKVIKTKTKYGEIFYKLYGALHREDGPAVECANGDKEWYLNGKLHREDGPAIEWGDGAKAWYIGGKLHRKDGPAIEYADGTKEWYLNGQQYRNEQEWQKAKEEVGLK